MPEDRVARERVAALNQLMLLWREENQRSGDLFQISVARRFATVNEFRGALSDLGQEMATRRELEQFQDEYRRAHSELTKDLATLRSRVDSGPSELHDVTHAAAVEAGRRQGTQMLTGFFYGIAGLAIGVLTVLAIWLH